jgi:hypothetical protein
MYIFTQYITITDYLLLPIHLFIIFVFASYYRNKYYPNKHPLRKYFMWALGVKIFGGIVVGMIYHYYYKGGDTFYYWYHSLTINSSLQESLVTWFKLITGLGDYYDPAIFTYASKMLWYDSPSDYVVPQVGAFLGLFALNSYLPMTALYSALSFIGVWKLFVVFTKLYPRLIKPMAFAFLFIPSVVFWGSGFMKDTITFSCLGWVTHFIYLIFFENKKIVANSIGAIFFLYIIFTIKSYLVMAFLPAVLLWGVGLLSYKIKDARLVLVARYFLYISAIGGLIIVGGRMQTELFGQYNVESIGYKSFVTRDYLFRISTEQDGSAYSLGDMDPTLLGMLEKAPAGINVTLFRPYPWEARKPIVMISAAEALFFLAFSIAVIFRNNPIRVVQRILADETLQFCIIFTLVFAFAVGISTSNFGSLVRYKIPCLPFYAAFLFIIFNPPKAELALKKKVKTKAI